MSLLPPVDVDFGGFGLWFLLSLISPKLCRNHYYFVTTWWMDEELNGEPPASLQFVLGIKVNA